MRVPRPLNRNLQTLPEHPDRRGALVMEAPAGGSKVVGSRKAVELELNRSEVMYMPLVVCNNTNLCYQCV